MKLNPIRRVKLYEQIVSLFREKADGGELKPGDILPPERDLVAQLGVSRASVREALQVMEIRGLVQTLPGSGRIFAGEGDVDLIQIRERVRESAVLEVLDAREAIECMTVELAANNANAADIKRLRATMAAANRSGDAGGYSYEHNSAFHLGISAASHNAVLNEMLKLLLNLRADVHRKDLLSPKQFKETFEDHSCIVDAIERRDGQTARSLMRQHICRTKHTIAGVPRKASVPTDRTNESHPVSLQFYKNPSVSKSNE